MIGLAVFASLVALREIRLSRKIAVLHQEREQWIADGQSLRARLDGAEARLAQVESDALSEPVRFSPGLKRETPPSAERIAALEQHVRALQLALDRQPIGLAIPEYDPTRSPTNPQPAYNLPPKRGWGTEQVVGPPDTVRPGDAPTAWAPLKANGGEEWLAVGFDNAVDVAEIRIRETYNPGAISKVSAVVNNAQVVLWEGVAAPGTTPRDFVIPVPEGVPSDTVLIQFDTTRVDSWSEVDAVELVGRDGSRQWASSANASSTYADATRAGSALTY